jgi:heat shock protein HtpX
MNVYSAISSNKWKTWLIIILFISFITTLAYVFGKANDAGVTFAVVALILAGISSIGSYFYSDKLVLATTGAKAITKDEFPDYYRIVENLCLGSGMPLPKMYVLDDPSPNAFATGRDPKHAVVCVTTGLLERLSKVELEGVIAHELSHIRNYDIRLMAIVAILVGFVAIIADMFIRSLWYSGNERRESRGQVIFLVLGIAFAFLSPLIATLIQLAVSRKREFLADASGVLLTRYPEGLASALEKIASDPTPTRSASNATAHLFISNPFKGKEKGAWLASLFNTHPPIEERVKILRSM